MNRAPGILEPTRPEAERRLAALLAPARLPGRKDENYRHTSLAGMDLDRRPSRVEPERYAGPAGAAEPGESALAIVSSGAPVAEIRLADEPFAAAGGFVGDLGAFLRRAPARILELARLAPCLEDDLFAALVDARGVSGIAVHAPRGARPSGVVRGVHHFAPGSEVAGDVSAVENPDALEEIGRAV